MLPREQLLQGSRRPEALLPLIQLAEQALHTWEPVWSSFVAADLREELEQRLGALSELTVSSAGAGPRRSGAACCCVAPTSPTAARLWRA